MLLKLEIPKMISLLISKLVFEPMPASETYHTTQTLYVHSFLWILNFSEGGVSASKGHMWFAYEEHTHSDEHTYHTYNWPTSMSQKHAAASKSFLLTHFLLFRCFRINVFPLAWLSATGHWSRL